MTVLDASTLILIAKIELLDSFLAGLGPGVVIPAEVAWECYGVKKTADALMIQRAVEKQQIRVIAVKNRKLVDKLQADFGLGEGEAEALALSVKAKARLLGIDDKNGIGAAKLLGIPFTTAMGILIRARQKGLIDRAEALRKLAALTRHGRYHQTIVQDARRRIEEPS